MTEVDINEAVEVLLKDMTLRAEIGLTKHDAQNLRRRPSIAKKLEVLFKANKLQLKNGSTRKQKTTA